MDRSSSLAPRPPRFRPRWGPSTGPPGGLPGKDVDRPAEKQVSRLRGERHAGPIQNGLRRRTSWMELDQRVERRSEMTKRILAAALALAAAAGPALGSSHRE